MGRVAGNCAEWIPVKFRRATRVEQKVERISNSLFVIGPKIKAVTSKDQQSWQRNTWHRSPTAEQRYSQELNANRNRQARLESTRQTFNSIMVAGKSFKEEHPLGESLIAEHLLIRVVRVSCLIAFDWVVVCFSCLNLYMYTFRWLVLHYHSYQ